MKPRSKDPLAKYRLLAELMDGIPDVIYFKDTKGRLLLVNKAHAQGLGLRPEQVVGKTDFDFFPKERAEAMAKDDELVFKSGKPIIDKVERATRPDGVDNYVSTTKIPRFDEKGKVIGLIGITRDITRRIYSKQAEEEKISLQKKLKGLEEINRLKSEFVSVVSHELRTPLAIIKEAISVLFDGVAGVVSDKQKEVLSRAIQNSERLKKIIDDLLDVSRMETGRLRLHYSLVNLNELILDSANYFKKLAADKGVALIYSLPKDQLNIFIDAERVNQVITNLITNAVKFTEENQKIEIEVVILENKIRIGVLDTGIGIREADLPRLFSKFTQVSNLVLAERKGLGLGLAIAKELVERHGGEIWAESKPGLGSKFYFTLPRFYSLNNLDAKIRNKVNSLLDKGLSVYLVNLLIINYKKFKDKIKISPRELFSDFKTIIEACLLDHFAKEKDRFEVIMPDEKIGECSVIVTEAKEKEIAEFCLVLKERLNSYLEDNKIEGAFITLGLASFPSDVKHDVRQVVSANIYFKQILIGAEMRRHPRLNYRLGIDVVYDKTVHSSDTIDISEGGLCFFNKVALKTDSTITARIKLPKNKKPLQLKGRVAWVGRAPEQAGEALYKIGLEFIGLSTQQKAALRKASARLLVTGEDVVNNLSAQAKKLRINIKSLDPDDKISLPNRARGYDVQELPISLNLVCDFKTLGEYLDTLRNEFPALIRVKQLNISSDAEVMGGLDVTLKISAYLLKKI
jgi:PAS domain S-box-containing protein